MARVAILKGSIIPPPFLGWPIIRLTKVRACLRRPRLLLRLLRGKPVLLVPVLDTLINPTAHLLLMTMLGLGRGRIHDVKGSWLTADAATLIRQALRLLRDRCDRQALRHLTGRIINRQNAIRGTCSFDRRTRPVFIRGEANHSAQAGGSIGHIAGVVNHLGDHFELPTVLSFTQIALVGAQIQQVVLHLGHRFWDCQDDVAVVNSLRLAREARRLLNRTPADAFIYERLSRSCFAGMVTARTLRIPFILEYNGSDVWVDQHWGGQNAKQFAFAECIELANLRAASAIVVVSAPLRDELVARGIPSERILVNPNGVDPDRYHPGIDGGLVRANLGIPADAIVVGFIGTFGPWHGAEVLAQAWARCAASAPQAKLVFIGDGGRGPATRSILEATAPAETWRWVGLVPQAQGPAYLAACDILVNATVPNPDGSRFFGSPTKLFEYLAMGRAIISSDLEQMGEILVHESTALLVRAGDVTALADALLRLVNDTNLRRSLGEAGRAEAVSKHSWRAHTQRIIDFLRQSHP